MPRRYGMVMAGGIHGTFQRSNPSNRNRRGQYHELVQHLTDLCYLSLDYFRRWHLRRAANEAPSRGQLNTLVAAVATSLPRKTHTGNVVWSQPFPNQVETLPGGG